MPEFPIMPVHVANLIADTEDMTHVQFAAYVKILLHLWLEGGRLPEKRLRAVSGLAVQTWYDNRERICAPLVIIDGVVSQKRLEDFRLKVKDKRQKAAQAAQARWAKKRNANAYANASYGGNAIEIRKKERILPVQSEHEDTPVEKKTHQPTEPAVPPEVASERVRLAASPYLAAQIAGRPMPAPEAKPVSSVEPESELGRLMRRKGWVP